MTNFTTTNSTAPPLTTAEHPHNYLKSPIIDVLCVVGVIILISYTLFMTVCRRNPTGTPPSAEVSGQAARVDLVCGFKYRKTAEADSNDGGESCPVCLSVFAEGEEIRQLSACKHAFHAVCVDLWLYSHSSCPVCRAAVPVKRLKRVLADGKDDYRHGLPDASSLI